MILKTWCFPWALMYWRVHGAKHDIRGQRIIISGIDDPMAGEEVFATQLESCVPEKEETGYRILLTHRPERINKYLDYPFDLVMAGHAHGGQWRIPGIMNGLIAPHQGLFPKYAGEPLCF